MEDSTLVRMANQIAAYFEPYPRTEAVDGILKHIHNFWEPRMRDQLKEYLDKGGEGLSPLFIEAAHAYFKGPRTPRSKAGPAQKASAS
jgi:formate dehydrogenase subunit delta